MFKFIRGRMRRSSGPRTAQMLLPAALLLAGPKYLAANVIFYSGDLRTNANVIDCGTGCTLGPANTDGEYAQWAAVIYSFTVNSTTTMEAITYGYAGGASLTGPAVAAGGLEPYLSLFDASGNFLASTFFGTTCPPGANSVGGNCFDVSLDGGTLTPGTYQIALTAFENMSLVENGVGTSLADGFTGLGNLELSESLNYAFDVILPDNVETQNTPEPASLSLVAIACVMLASRKRKTN